MSSRVLKKGTTTVASEGYTYDHMNWLREVNRGGVADSFAYYWTGELLSAHYGGSPDLPYNEGQDPDLDTTDTLDPNAGYQPPETAEAEPPPPQDDTPPPDSTANSAPSVGSTPSDTPPAEDPTKTQKTVDDYVGNGQLAPDGPQPDLPNRNVTYTLDKAGNRTSVTDNLNGNATYAPNTLNQYTGSMGGEAISNGNEHEISTYKNIKYSYINDERLSSVSTPVINPTSTYNLYYDALGRCVKRVLNGAITYYIYDGEKPILEYRSTAPSNPAKNVYGKGIDEILMRYDPSFSSAVTYYYAQDHEGNVTQLLNTSGNVVETYKYDAFGAPAIYDVANPPHQLSSSAYSNRFLFTGREYANLFGFYEYRARAYHPMLGRFMSEDPKLFDAGDYNLFRYCHNDPIDFTDPMGTDYGPFDSPDQAYRFFDAKWNAVSIRQNQEYRVDTYRMSSGRYYVTDPTTGQGDRAKQPPILVKDATRSAINHSHGNWSKGYVDQQRQQHIEGPARNAREDSFDSGNPSKTDKQTAQHTTVYTSTPAHEGWRQGPGDKEPERVRPMRDSNDKPAGSYKQLTPQEVEKMELPPGYRGAGVPPTKPQ